MKSKAQYKTGNKLDVHAIDLAVFLEKYKDDTILLKMDIEGAEFPVLEHLIKTGADKYINKLYVEMHPNKVPEYTSTYSATLLSRLKCGEVNEWH